MKEVIEILKKHDFAEKVMAVGRCARFSGLKDDLTNKELVADVACDYISWLLENDKLTEEEDRTIIGAAFGLLAAEAIKEFEIDVNKVDTDELTKDEKVEIAIAAIIKALHD